MNTNPNAGNDRSIIFILRLCMAWVFLYAASHQVFVPGWSATGFLSHTKTFHWLFAPLTAPGIGGLVSFLVMYGHLAIGLSLLFGLFVRASSIAAAVLMILYWMAHMDFPYVSNPNNFLLDDHIVYAIVLWLLIVRQAGHIWGLDAWASKLAPVRHNGLLTWAAN